MGDLIWAAVARSKPIEPLRFEAGRKLPSLSRSGRTVGTQTCVARSLPPNAQKCNLQVPKLPIRPPKISHRSRTGRIDRAVNDSSHRAVRYGPISSGGRISSTASQGWVESACRLALGGAFAWHPHLQKERGGNAATITNPKTVYGCQRHNWRGGPGVLSDQ